MATTITARWLNVNRVRMLVRRLVLGDPANCADKSCLLRKQLVADGPHGANDLRLGCPSQFGTKPLHSSVYYTKIAIVVVSPYPL
jgi:hypothetical protein